MEIGSLNIILDYPAITLIVVSIFMMICINWVIRLKQINAYDKIKELKSSVERIERIINNVCPQGIIVLWNGNLNKIPNGFVLCDGQNGTPDLRNRFVIGCSQQYNTFAKGGSEQHNHGITVNPHKLAINEMPSHYHKQGYMSPSPKNKLWEKGNYSGVYYTNSSESGDYTAKTGGDQAHSHIASCSNQSTLPPFMALAYIMKQ